MKYQVFLLLLFSLVCCQDPNMESVNPREQHNANQRSMHDAMDIASNFLFKDHNITRATEPLASSYIWSPKDEGGLFFYIINYENENGFVIVSSDKRATPVYAYSYTGNLDPEAIPNTGVELLLNSAIDCCQSEILSTDTLSYTSFQLMDPTTGPQSWLISSYNGEECYLEIINHNTMKNPLMSTTWAQCNPYNYYCPNALKEKWEYRGKTSAGCGPVALAQVMRYHEHPTSFNDTILQWNQMNDDYSVFSSPTSAVEAARLIYMIAIDAHAVFGDKDSISTSTTLGNLKSTFEHFGYSLSVSNSFIPQRITNSILDNKPVVIFATHQETRKGHAWVIDGCQIVESRYIYRKRTFPYDEIASEGHAQRYYHCNWGGGANNGDAYYLASFRGYSEGISFFYDIQPN